MKIQWNRVTWYSKLVALILFVALPFIGFYYGIGYGKALQTLNDAGSTTSGVSSQTNLLEYYTNSAEWQMYQGDNAGFTISYPIDFNEEDFNSVTPTTDWEVNNDTQTPGILSFKLVVPKAFEPQTNFSDATLTVGESKNNQAIANCLKMPPEAVGNTSQMTINGIAFTTFTAGGAGAGNLYETKSYRALHADTCYAIDYTIHSNQIANYPSSYNLKPFDEAKIKSLMQNVVNTFKFL